MHLRMAGDGTRRDPRAAAEVKDFLGSREADFGHVLHLEGSPVDIGRPNLRPGHRLPLRAAASCARRLRPGDQDSATAAPDRIPTAGTKRSSGTAGISIEAGPRAGPRAMVPCQAAPNCSSSSPEDEPGLLARRAPRLKRASPPPAARPCCWPLPTIASNAGLDPHVVVARVGAAPAGTGLDARTGTFGDLSLPA
jgi:hypothetical protein